MNKMKNKSTTIKMIAFAFLLISFLAIALSTNVFAASEFAVQNASNIFFSVDRIGNVNATGNTYLATKSGNVGIGTINGVIV